MVWVCRCCCSCASYEMCAKIRWDDMGDRGCRHLFIILPPSFVLVVSLNTHRLLSPSLSLLKSTSLWIAWIQSQHTEMEQTHITTNNIIRSTYLFSIATTMQKTNNALCSTHFSPPLQRHNMILVSTNYASPYPNLTPPNHPRYASFPASTCHVSIRILVKLFTIKYRRRRIGIEIWVLSRYWFHCELRWRVRRIVGWSSLWRDRRFSMWVIEGGRWWRGSFTCWCWSMGRYARDDTLQDSDWQRDASSGLITGCGSENLDFGLVWI